MSAVSMAPIWVVVSAPNCVVVRAWNCFVDSATMLPVVRAGIWVVEKEVMSSVDNVGIWVVVNPATWFVVRYVTNEAIFLLLETQWREPVRNHEVNQHKIKLASAERHTIKAISNYL